MKSFEDAILALEDVQNFLEDRGHVTASSLTFIGPAVDAVASLQVAAVKQRTLCDYFSVQLSYSWHCLTNNYL